MNPVPECVLFRYPSIDKVFFPPSPHRLPRRIAPLSNNSACFENAYINISMFSEIFWKRVLISQKA